MTVVLTWSLLLLTALSLGLRTTSFLIPRAHSFVRLLASLAIGTALVVASGDSVYSFPPAQ